MTDREPASRATQACSIIAHYPTNKDTPVEIHWLIKQAAWGLGKSVEESFDLEIEFRNRVTAELAAKAVPGEDEIVEAMAKAIENSEDEFDASRLAFAVIRSIIATLQAQIATAREDAFREALEAQPTTHIDPDESMFDRGFFDAVMAYQKKIRSLITTPAPEKENGNG